jgi:hypothetical protein
MSMRYSAGFISAFYNPLKNPDAPTIGTATAGSGSLSITFTAPSNVGGSAITSYTAIAKRTSDGILFTASGASSPITVSGLTADAFTAIVVAVNSYGPSASSAASNSATPIPTIGDAFGGGFYAGQIGVSSVATHYIVVGPVASAQNLSITYKNAATATAGADSVIDGPQNTADIVADGNSTVYPAGHFCNDLVVGGFSDLKPDTTSNQTSSGINANAVPARASNYTAGTPAQTTATDFQSSGAEDFVADSYWSSTEFSAMYAWVQYFNNGRQKSDGYKSSSGRVRAIRRVAV